MKNFKKLIAMFGIVAMIGTMLSPSAFAQANYGAEVVAGYEYALANGVTTVDNIDLANPYGLATREQAAKQFVNIAKAINPAIVADDTADCTFVDLGNADASLVPFITEVCEMGIMGQNMPEMKFLPFNTVDRAQVATMLSRIIWGDKYDGGTPWYAAHMEALKDAGIMTNISNPMAPTARYEIWLMAQRTDDADMVDVLPEECQDPMVQLSCALGLGEPDCPAVCSATEEEVVDEEEIKVGYLDVSLNGNSLADGSEIPSTGVIRFAVVDFSASNDSDVSLKSVELKKMGLASIPSGTRVWFEQDGIRVSGKAAFTSEGVSIVSFAPAFEIKKGAGETLDLYVELATAAGQDFQFSSINIDSTAINVNGGFTTPKLRTANYAVAPTAVALASNGGTSNVTDNGSELGAFKLTNVKPDGVSETRDLRFKSITLRQSGNADLENLSDIVLERNGEVVSVSNTINGRDITFTVGNVIKDATSATYYVKAIINNVELAEDTYKFELRNTTDLNIVEVNTAFRSTVTTTPSPFVFNEYKIIGGELTFVRDTDYPLSEVYAAGSEVVLMKGTVSSKSAVTLEDPTVFTSPSMTGLDSYFSTIYLQVGNSTFSYSPSASSTDTGAAFLGSAFLDGEVNVKMYATLKDTAPAGTVKFADLKLSSFLRAEYVSNGYAVTTAVGSIAGISVESQKAALDVTRTDGLGDTNVSQGSSNVLTYGLTLSSNQGNGVNFSRISLNIAGNTDSSGFIDNSSMTMFIDGSPIQSKNIDSGVVYFDSFNKAITVGVPVSITFETSFEEAFNSGDFQLTLGSIDAYDILTSEAITVYSMPVGATFTLSTAIGRMAVSNENPLTSLYLSPSSDQKFVAFKMSAENDNVKLYDVVMTGINITGNLSNFRLVDSNLDLLKVGTVTGGLVEFKAIPNAPVITKDTSATYYVIADVNNSTNATNISMTVDRNSTNVKGTNGLTVAATGSSAVSRIHAVSENVMVLAKQANPNKALVTSALRFTVTADGKNAVDLTGVVVNITPSGYLTAGAMIRVYKDSVNTSSLAGELAYAVGDQTVVMTGSAGINSTVDAGTSVEYIVVLEGALVDSSASSTDWIASLKDVIFDGFSASNYNNIGDLPFTEIK